MRGFFNNGTRNLKRELERLKAEEKNGTQAPPPATARLINPNFAAQSSAGAPPPPAHADDEGEPIDLSQAELVNDTDQNPTEKHPFGAARNAAQNLTPPEDTQEPLKLKLNNPAATNSAENDADSIRHGFPANITPADIFMNEPAFDWQNIGAVDSFTTRSGQRVYTVSNEKGSVHISKNEIEFYGKMDNEDAAIMAAVLSAKKEWGGKLAIDPKSQGDFVDKIYITAMRAGVEVTNFTPSDELRQRTEQIMKRDRAFVAANIAPQAQQEPQTPVAENSHPQTQTPQPLMQPQGVQPHSSARAENTPAQSNAPEPSPADSETHNSFKAEPEFPAFKPIKKQTMRELLTNAKPVFLETEQPIAQSVNNAPQENTPNATLKGIGSAPAKSAAPQQEASKKATKVGLGTSPSGLGL